MNAMTEQMAKQVYEATKEVLDGMEVSYEAEQDEDGDYVVVFDYRGEDAMHRMVVRSFIDRGLLTFSERLSFDVEPSKLPAVLDAVNRLNASLFLGTFYYDYESTCVRFYNPLLFNNSIISKDTVEEMLMRTVNIIEEYDDRLSAVNKGYLASEDVKKKD